MEPELIKVLTNGGVGVSCLLTLIWALRFVLTRVETAVRENTMAVKDLCGYLKRQGMYVSGGREETT